MWENCDSLSFPLSLSLSLSLYQGRNIDCEGQLLYEPGPNPDSLRFCSIISRAWIGVATNDVRELAPPGFGV